jgi:prepilin-type N-terminal cleavage/methylation domain-containing protein
MTTPVPRRRHSPEAGFTLIELVVGLALLAITLAVAANGLRSLGRSSDRAASALARHEVLSRGIDVLRRDVERMQLLTWAARDRRESVFAGDARSLEFVVMEPAVPSQPGPYLVMYEIVSTKTGDQLLRRRAPYDRNVKSWRDLKPEGEPVIVIEGPYRLQLSYQEAARDRVRWVAKWQIAARTPKLIRLQVTDTEDGRRSPGGLVFALRIDAEAGCVAKPAANAPQAPVGALVGGVDPNPVCTPRTAAADAPAGAAEPPGPPPGQAARGAAP